MIFPCGSGRLLLLHPLVLVAVAAFLHAPSLFTPVFSSWTVQLSSPTYLSPDSRVYVRANVLFEDTVAAGIPDDWQVSVLFNGKEMRRFSTATVNYGVIVNDQQWVQISVCLLDSTSRMVACDHATTLCIPETLSSLPPCGNNHRCHYACWYDWVPCTRRVALAGRACSFGFVYTGIHPRRRHVRLPLVHSQHPQRRFWNMECALS